MNEQQQFSEWCLVELFGHTRLAGLVSEVTIAGASMIRIDIPETSTNHGFTKFHNPSAVYGITPITQELANHLAEQFGIKPIERWDVRDFLDRVKQKALEEGGEV